MITWSSPGFAGVVFTQWCRQKAVCTGKKAWAGEDRRRWSQLFGKMAEMRKEGRHWASPQRETIKAKTGLGHLFCGVWGTWVLRDLGHFWGKVLGGRERMKVQEVKYLTQTDTEGPKQSRRRTGPHLKPLPAGYAQVGAGSSHLCASIS